MGHISTPQVPKILTQNREINQLQNYVAQAFASQTAALNNSPFVAGQLLINQKLIVSQNNSIAHGLGYLPTGYIVLSIDANTPVWQSGFTTTSINLHTNFTCSVNLWVF